MTAPSASPIDWYDEKACSRLRASRSLAMLSSNAAITLLATGANSASTKACLSSK